MGTEVGPSADLYSLGIITYELLSGRVPFADPTETPVRILLRHVNDPVPSLHTINPGLDPQLVAWVERLLEKDPARRPESAQAAWNDLEEIMLRLLGPMWRREARLLAPTAAGETRALTPAAFELTVKAPERAAPGAPASAPGESRSRGSTPGFRRIGRRFAYWSKAWRIAKSSCQAARKITTPAPMRAARIYPARSMVVAGDPFTAALLMPRPFAV